MIRNRTLPLIVAAVGLLYPAILMAQSGPALLLKPWPKEQVLNASTDVLFFGATDVERTGEDFRLSIYESTGRVRILPGNVASPRIGYDFYHLHIDTDHDLLPRHLSDQSLAAGAFVGQFDGWFVGFTAGGGYAGDTPFSDGQAWYAKSTLIVGKEFHPNSQLIIGLDYDGNRTFLPDVPLPGFAYAFKLPERNFQFVVGAPVNALIWQPNDKFRAEFAYTISDRLDARVGYQIVKDLNAFVRLETRNTAFHLDELGGNDRLFFEQRRAEGGLLWTPRPFVSLLAAGGWAFNQKFRTGWDSRDLETLLKLDDGPYVRFAVELQF